MKYAERISGRVIMVMLTAIFPASCAAAGDEAVTAHKNTYDVATASAGGESRIRTLIRHMDELTGKAVSADIAAYMTGGTKLWRVSGEEIFVRFAINAEESVYTIFIAPKGSYAGNLDTATLCTVRIDPLKLASEQVADHLVIAADTAFSGDCDPAAPPSEENGEYYAMLGGPVQNAYKVAEAKNIETESNGTVKVRIIQRAGKDFDRIDALKWATREDPIRQYVSYPELSRTSGHAVLDSGNIVQYDMGESQENYNFLCVYSGADMPVIGLHESAVAAYCAQKICELQEARLEALRQEWDENPPVIEVMPIPQPE